MLMDMAYIGFMAEQDKKQNFIDKCIEMMYDEYDPYLVCTLADESGITLTDYDFNKIFEKWCDKYLYTN